MIYYLVVTLKPDNASAALRIIDDWSSQLVMGLGLWMNLREKSVQALIVTKQV